jgi:hypothetical protein
MSAKCTVAGCGKWSSQGCLCREHTKAAAEALASAPKQPSSSPAALPLTGPAPSGGREEEVMHNGYAYRSLARHNPHSQEIIISIYSRDYSVEFYSVDPPWELCPDTHDARHVCATYPWATRALVFADGSACWTNNSTPHPRSYTKLTPGSSHYIDSRTYLHQKEGKYGAAVGWEEVESDWATSGPSAGETYKVTYKAEADVLLRRCLP